MSFVPLAQPFVESHVRRSSPSRHWQVRGCATPPNGISIADMSRIKPAYGRHFGESTAAAFDQPTWRGAQAATGSRTLLHLTLEAEGTDVLERIRAALPAGCRMEVRIANIASGPGFMPSRTEAGRPEMSAFTGRQREVLALLLEGLSNKEIGRRLALSHFTVRNHVSQSLRLLNVSSRKAAIARLAAVDADRDGAASPTSLDAHPR